jgi:hypothetical protein
VPEIVRALGARGPMLAGMGRVPAVALLLARILAGIWEWMGLPTMALQPAPLEWAQTLGGNLGVLAGEGGKLGMGVLALRGGVPSGRDVAGLDGLGALGEGVFCPLPDIVGAWAESCFVLGGACNLLARRCCRARQQLYG